MSAVPLVTALDRRALDPHPGGSPSLRTRSMQHSTFFTRRLNLVQKLDGHAGCVNTVVWSASGNAILSGSDDCCLNIWQPDSPQPLLHSIPSGHMTNIFSAKWLSNTGESHIVSCSADGVVRFTNVDDFVHKNALQSWTPGKPFRCHAGMTYEVTPDPADPHVFFDCSEDGTVNSYDLREISWCDCRGNCRRHVMIDVGRGSHRSRTRRFPFFNADPEEGVTAISIRPDFPAHLALACADDTVRVYDRRFAGRPPRGSDHPSRPQMIYSFIPDSMRPEPSSSPASPSVRENPNRAPVRHRIPHKITSLKYDPYGGGDILVSYSREKLFLIRPNGLAGKSFKAGGGISRSGVHGLKRSTRSSESLSSSGLGGASMRKKVAKRASDETRLDSLMSRRKRRGRNYWKRREGSSESSALHVAEGGVMHNGESSPLLRANECSDAGGCSGDEGLSISRGNSDNAERSELGTFSASTATVADPETFSKCNGEATIAGNDPKPNRDEDPKIDREPTVTTWGAVQLTPQSLPAAGENGTWVSKLVEPTAPGEQELTSRRNSNRPKRVEIVTVANDDSDDESEETNEEDTSSEDGAGSGNLLHMSWRSTESVSDEEDNDEEDSEEPDYDLVHSSDEGADSEAEEEKRACIRGGDNHIVQTYRGHRNEHTMIKEANFFGPRSEYVMSGSDDGRIFIWDKHSAEIVNVMKGDSKVVNCLQPHPHLPVLATSGIDDDIKIWHPSAEGPPDLSNLDEIIRQNETLSGGALGAATGRTIVLPAHIILQMLGAMLMD